MNLRELAAQYSEVQVRTVDVALELFAAHGVGGTSLQMIADKLGVTKAAVYHQFSTKDAIVLAVIETQLVPLEDAVGAAANPDDLLVRLVDAVVAHRGSLSTLQGDPVMFRLLGEYAPSRRMFGRLFAMLLGENLDARARVKVSVLSAALGAVAYPLVETVSDKTLRDELVAAMRKILS